MSSPNFPDPFDDQQTFPFRELFTSRVVDAPLELVFTAFSDPLQLVQWWGPVGFTNTFREFDFRPDGKWRFTMHGSDGTEYLNENTFIDIIPNVLIILFHETHPQFRLGITFGEEGPQTMVCWSQVYYSVREYQSVSETAFQAIEQTLDRLVAHAAKTA